MLKREWRDTTREEAKSNNEMGRKNEKKNCCNKEEKNERKWVKHIPYKTHMSI